MHAGWVMEESLLKGYFIQIRNFDSARFGLESGLFSIASECFWHQKNPLLIAQKRI